MKKITIPIFILLLLSSCTSINLFLMKDRMPETDLLKFEENDLSNIRTSVYKTKRSTITISVVTRSGDTNVLSVRDSSDENRISVNGDKTAPNVLAYEYHFDRNTLAAVFIVGRDGAKHKLDQTMIPSHETTVVAEKKGYKIQTHAGSFSCSIRIEKEKDTYYVYFLNADILGRVVRCLILDESGYRSFTALRQDSQERFLTEEMIEIYKTGR